MSKAIGATAPWTLFTRDLRLSLDAMRKSPALPLMTAVLVLGYEVPILLVRVTGVGVYLWLAFVFELAMCGFVGTERIWFLRVFDGGDLSVRESARVTRAMVGRYFRLSCFVLGPFGLVYAWLRNAGSVGIVIAVPFFIAYDVALTFCVPALAYSTKRAVAALQTGWQLLRAEWPRCAWYALTPPLAALALLRSLPTTALPSGPVFLLAVSSQMIGLWFKGAVAAYYLRVNPTGINGSL